MLENHVAGQKHKRKMMSLGLGDNVEKVNANATYLNASKLPKHVR